MFLVVLAFLLVCFFVTSVKEDTFLVVLAFLLVCFFVTSAKEDMFLVVLAFFVNLFLCYFCEGSHVFGSVGLAVS